MTDHNVISAFSEEQAQQLTGVSRRQLRHWDRTGFFSPSLADENRREPHSRAYSFRDIRCLKVLNTLRNEIGVSLPHLRDVKDKLAHLGDDVWVKTTLFVLRKHVYFKNPETAQRENVVTGQGALQIPLLRVQDDLEQAVRSLWTRDAATIGKVQRRRGVARNRPVIAGTRVPVDAIKAFRDAGYTVEQILEEYPGLTDEDIKAALEYGEAA